VGPLPARRAGVVTFGSLHKLAKLNGAVLDLWSELLARVPGSRLLLVRNTLQGRLRDDVAAQFARRGVGPDRLELRHTLPREGGHLGLYHEIDLALDVFPWSGHTTACEALWMGVPVVTLAGDRHASRMTASVLTALGWPELIATTPGQYLETARALAGDLDRLEAARLGLRDRMRASRLCDGEGFTRDLETAYRRMWQRRCDGRVD
jgi:predicted O-linked N-acetylglucosamine transferase (SPINDLY family)